MRLARRKPLVDRLAPCRGCLKSATSGNSPGSRAAQSIHVARSPSNVGSINRVLRLSRGAGASPRAREKGRAASTGRRIWQPAKVFFRVHPLEHCGGEAKMKLTTKTLRRAMGRALAAVARIVTRARMTLETVTSLAHRHHIGIALRSPRLSRPPRLGGQTPVSATSGPCHPMESR
jgi:hypothetical protein